MIALGNQPARRENSLYYSEAIYIDGRPSLHVVLKWMGRNTITAGWSRRGGRVLLSTTTLGLLMSNGCTEGSVPRVSGSGGVVASGGNSNSDVNCLAEGTMISTPLGGIPIELLRPGAEVHSFNHETQRVERDRVVATRNDVRPIGRLGQLRLTLEHPVFDFSAGSYRPAGEWQQRSGTVLGLSADWEVPFSLRRRAELLADVAPDPLLYHPEEGASRVYDVSVEQNHNLFANGVLVHNKSPLTGGNLSYDQSDTCVVVCPGSERDFVFDSTAHSVSGDDGIPFAMSGSAGNGGSSSGFVEFSFRSDDCAFASGRELYLWSEPGVSYEIWQSSDSYCHKDMLLESGAIEGSAVAAFDVPKYSYVTVKAELGHTDCLVMLDSASSFTPETVVPVDYCVLR